MNKNKRYPALFMAPGVLIYGVFFILPVLIGVWYSFTNWNFTRADFVGLMNYKNIISDPSIKRALLNTIIFTVVTTVGKVGLGLALAVFLNRKLHPAQLSARNQLLPGHHQYRCRWHCLYGNSASLRPAQPVLPRART